MSVEIRRVTSEEELEAVYRLRYRIYIEEIGFQFPFADHAGKRLPDSVKRPSWIYSAVDGGEVVGTCKCDWGGAVEFTPDEFEAYELARFLPAVGPAGIGIFSRFMAAPTHRSGDVPAGLFDAVFEALRDCGTQLMFLDCRPHLITTYERLGFRTYAKTYSDPVSGLLVPMVLLMDDQEHLRRVRCRWANFARYPGASPERLARLLEFLPHESPVHTVGTGGEREERDLAEALSAESGRNHSIFHDLTPADIQQIVQHSHVIECQPGDKVISEHVSDQTVFLVLEGHVEVRRGTRLLAVLGAGEVFGEIAFLLQVHRTADVFAVGPGVRILAVRQKNLAQLIESESRLAARLLLNLSRILAGKLAKTAESTRTQ